MGRMTVMHSILFYSAHVIIIRSYLDQCTTVSFKKKKMVFQDPTMYIRSYRILSDLKASCRIQWAFNNHVVTMLIL